ncbi:bile acid:sodium symporter, partial [Streptomyces sp. ME02-6977A]|uniref:bile acid:sodium symporter n=1 Tax=Streptomyces sp. ME02-6977A TaxID=3028671 RepID=UPI0029A1E397
HITVLACTFVVFPLLGLAARGLEPVFLDHSLYTGLLFLTLVPSTVKSSIAFTSMARGNVPAAICAGSFSSLAGIVLTPLLAAALLTVLLTTTVLATLTAYSGAIGDAALRHSLAEARTGADAALIVKADVPAAQRSAADATVREGAAKTFDGLPRTVRTLVRSGPYALPGSLRPPTERSGDPDLTFFAALDPTQVRVDEGRLPEDGGGGKGG